MEETIVYVYSYSSLDLHKDFPEEAHSIALHPSGLFVLVGFSEKLRLMSLLIDDIRPYKEFLIRGCREVSISRSCFACVHVPSAINKGRVVIYLLMLTTLSAVFIQPWWPPVCCSQYQPHSTLLHLFL